MDLTERSLPRYLSQQALADSDGTAKYAKSNAEMKMDSRCILRLNRQFYRQILPSSSERKS